MKINNNEVLLSKIFVDDIIFGGKGALCKYFVDEMKKEFEMSMFGEIKFFVGLQVYQIKQGIFISQSKYIKEIFKTFDMEDLRPVSTPMEIGHKLAKNDDSINLNQKFYRSIMGKVQCVVHRKLDIALAVGIVEIFFASPQEIHMMEVKGY